MTPGDRVLVGRGGLAHRYAGGWAKAPSVAGTAACEGRLRSLDPREDDAIRPAPADAPDCQRCAWIVAAYGPPEEEP